MATSTTTSSSPVEAEGATAVTATTTAAATEAATNRTSSASTATSECVFQSSSKLDFDYPLEGMETKQGNSGRRSCLKKRGQSRTTGHQSSMLLKVHFSEVLLREYGMVLGDNPAVSHGAPVQLEWEPQEEHDPVHIDNYEKARSMWRATDRRGFLLNAHKRVKILFAAGYTIDEIATATMQMKELRKQRAESLKSQGMIGGAISALLSGAAETTGHTVRSVQIIPNAIAGGVKVVVSGTTKTLVGGMGLTNRVVGSTVNMTLKSGQMFVDGVSTSGKMATDFVVKGTTGVVKGTTHVVKGTTQLGVDVVKGTSKFGMDAVKGTTQLGVGVVKGTSKFGMDAVKGTTQLGVGVVKGTSNVMVGSTKAVVKGTGSVVKGTGVLFVGTSKAGYDMVNKTTKRLSKMVTNTMDLSSPSDGGRSSFRRGLGISPRQKNQLTDDMSESSHSNSMDASRRSDNQQLDGSSSHNNRGNFIWGSRGGGNKKNDRKSTGGLDPARRPLSNSTIRRQVSFESGLEKKAKEMEEEADFCEELHEMEDFLTQLEGMDKHKVHDILQQEQELIEKRKGTSFAGFLPINNNKKNNSNHGNNNKTVDELGSQSLHSPKRTKSPRRRFL